MYLFNLTLVLGYLATIGLIAYLGGKTLKILKQKNAPWWQHAVFWTTVNLIVLFQGFHALVFISPLLSS